MKAAWPKLSLIPSSRYATRPRSPEILDSPFLLGSSRSPEDSCILNTSHWRHADASRVHPSTAGGAHPCRVPDIQLYLLVRRALTSRKTASDSLRPLRSSTTTPSILRNTEQPRASSFRKRKRRCECREGACVHSSDVGVGRRVSCRVMSSTPCIVPLAC